MICKYNIYQLSALRMFIFSIVSILCNSILIFMFSIVNEEINLLRALAISITALFLFSSVFLYVLLNTSHKITKYFMIVGWIIINLALMISKNNYYNVLLTKLPIYVHCAKLLGAILLAIVLAQINFWIVVGTALSILVTFWTLTKISDARYKRKKELNQAERRNYGYGNLTTDFSYGKDIRIYNFQNRFLQRDRKSVV